MRNGMKKWIQKTEGKKDDYIPTSEGVGGWFGPRNGVLAYLHTYWRGHISWGSALARAQWQGFSPEERHNWYGCIASNFGGNTIVGEVGVHDRDRYWDREAGESVSWDTLHKRQARREADALARSTRTDTEDDLEAIRLARW